MMDMDTGSVIQQQKVTSCAITQMVVDRVELLATRQG